MSAAGDDRPPSPDARDDGTVALELNDAGLLAVSAAGPLAPPSPGYAAVDGDRLLTGHAARQRARLTPRRAHHRFWHRLDDTPLPRPFPRRWTYADLIHRHLADLRTEAAVEPERVLAVVGGDREHDELARLLGIAAAAGWPIAGLVDAAVVAAWSVASDSSDGSETKAVWYLDLGLHRTVASEVIVGAEMSRRRVAVGDVGLVALERSWARLFARRLVRATRYDPLHSAAGEQRLYDAMDGWLAELRAADRVVASLVTAGREHAVEVARDEVVAVAGDAYRRITALLPPDLDPGSCRLVLGPRAAALPGLASTLESIAGAAVELVAGAAARGALAARDLILDSGDDPSFVVRLPRSTRGAA